MNIDIGMTCILRPQIIKDTLLSWDYNIIKQNRNINFRLILNIDPIGENILQKNIFNITKKYFPGKIIPIYPETPSFPLAVRNIIEKIDTEFCFLTEDDMVILRHININKMIRILESNPNLASLRLDKNNTLDSVYQIKRKIKGSYKNEGYYLLNGHKRAFSMNTSLFRTNFLKEILPFIESDVSPERLLRLIKWKSKEKYKELNDIMRKWQFGIFMKPKEKPQIQDIGTGWKERMGLKKTNGGLHGTYRKK